MKALKKWIRPLLTIHKRFLTEAGNSGDAEGMSNSTNKKKT